MSILFRPKRFAGLGHHGETRYPEIIWAHPIPAPSVDFTPRFAHGRFHALGYIANCMLHVACAAGEDPAGRLVGGWAPPYREAEPRKHNKGIARRHPPGNLEIFKLAILPSGQVSAVPLWHQMQRCGVCCA